MTRRTTEPPQPNRPARWFCVAWPLAVLFHLVGNPYHLLVGDVVGRFQIALALAALWLLAESSSADSGRGRPAAAAVLGALHLVVLFLKLPVVGNHEVLLGLIALSAVLSVAVGGRRWFDISAPSLRYALIVSYAWIAWSKLNTGFLDPEVSCAVVFGDEMGEWVGLAVSESVFWSAAVITITLLVESSVPLLLLWPATRTIGVLVGMGFHFGLALDPVAHVWDFSSVLVALFLLFSPLDVQLGLDRRVRGLADRHGRYFLVLLVAMALAVDSIIVKAGQPQWWLAYPLWFIYGGAAALLVVRTLWRGHRSAEVSEATPLGRCAPVGLVVVAFALLNGLSPYLELRTAGAYNMYSNLHTAQGDSNHLVVRRTLPLIPQDLWSVAEADGDDALGVYSLESLLVPERNLARFVAGGGTSQATLYRAEEALSLDQIDLDTDGFGFVIGSKLGALRAVDPMEPKRCLRTWGPAN